MNLMTVVKLNKNNSHWPTILKLKYTVDNDYNLYIQHFNLT